MKQKFYNILIVIIVISLVLFNLITIQNLLLDQQYIAKEISNDFQREYIYKQYSFLYKYLGINTLVILILFFMRKKY
jgi:uncharacterized membrane protein SpoIIM required for sporulation